MVGSVGGTGGAGWQAKRRSLWTNQTSGVALIAVTKPYHFPIGTPDWHLPLFFVSQPQDQNTSTGSNSVPNSQANCSGTFPLWCRCGSGGWLEARSLLPPSLRSLPIPCQDIEAEHQTNCLSHPQAGEHNRTCCLVTLYQGLTLFSLHPGRRRSSLLQRPGCQLALSMIPSNLSLRQNS